MAAAETTRVMFRVGDDGEVFALMPDSKADHQGHVDCYQHVGGHCAADYTGCIAASRPATEEEYTPLKEEMERIGYAVKVARRR